MLLLLEDGMLRFEDEEDLETGPVTLIEGEEGALKPVLNLGEGEVRPLLGLPGRDLRADGTRPGAALFVSIQMAVTY